jgi:ergothioneine biosynthesis protein EgtB
MESSNRRIRTPDEVIGRYLTVRADTEHLASRLSPEDQMLQSMPLCSPVKWHRAHTTWFFETFVLEPLGVRSVNSQYRYLFNSYYDAIGPRHARPKRGLLSRPSFEEVGEYRHIVDQAMQDQILALGRDQLQELLPMIDLGLAHEEQHQELLLTDILHAFHENPTLPAYRGGPNTPSVRIPAAQKRARSFKAFDGGLVEIGASGLDGFVFDNETPRHKVWLAPFQIATVLVTNREMKAFMAAGGYRTPSLWLAEGFDVVQGHGIEAPLYWRREGDAWMAFGLDGLREIADDEPLSHVSFYEADAIARFLGARLASEHEWEVVAATLDRSGNFRDTDALRPLSPRQDGDEVAQMFGDVWEWTRSSYEPYPGFRAAEGAIGEYNGKFMVNQRVLRGGSCLTPRGHVRASYRNYWHPETRFQMTGVRLARDAQ